MWENIPLFETQKRLAQNVQEAVRKERLANNSKGLANSLRGMGTGAQPSWWNELQNLKMPVLLMNGEYDEKFFCILKISKNASLTRNLSKLMVLVMQFMWNNRKSLIQ